MNDLSVRESELQFRLLVDAMPQLVWMANPDGHIFWYNQRWYEFTGTTRTNGGLGLAIGSRSRRIA